MELTTGTLNTHVYFVHRELKYWLTYLKIVPAPASPHHFKRTCNLGAGGGILKSHFICSSCTHRRPVICPSTEGGRLLLIFSSCAIGAVQVCQDLRLNLQIMLHKNTYASSTSQIFCRLCASHSKFYVDKKFGDPPNNRATGKNFERLPINQGGDAN